VTVWELLNGAGRCLKMWFDLVHAACVTVTAVHSLFANRECRMEQWRPLNPRILSECCSCAGTHNLDRLMLRSPENFR